MNHSPQNMRIAIVTGSARRVGYAIAEGLIVAGWRVIIHARSEAAAQESAKALGDAAIGFVGADLATLEGVERLAKRVIDITGGELALLVNSASSFEQVEHWSDFDNASWERAMNVNVRAPYQLTVLLLDALRRANGSVVNVSDRAAHEHWPSFPLHSASKAALESLTLSGAKTLKRDGVRMNAIVPGTILAPDSWSNARIEQERSAGLLSTPDALVETVIELAESKNRSGEITHLG